MNDSSMRALAIKVANDSGELEDLHIIINQASELVAVSKPKLLSDWLATRGKSAAVQPREIDEETKRDIQFFGGSPCWFPGCEQLRVDYAEELSKLEAASCKGCEKGALIRKYLKLIASAQQ